MVDTELTLVPSDLLTAPGEDRASRVTIGNSYGEQSLNNQPLETGSLVVDTHTTTVDESQFEALYATQFDFLHNVAKRKFRVPDTEAETLVHEVFLTYLKRFEGIRDVHGWLLGMICHASRYYWRSHVRDASPDEVPYDRIDPASLNILESLPDQLAAHEVLACLTPRAAQILRMRYFDGCSIQEIADHFGLKAKYTQKLVNKCLRQAERLYMAKEKRKA